MNWQPPGNLFFAKSQQFRPNGTKNSANTLSYVNSRYGRRYEVIFQADGLPPQEIPPAAAAFLASATWMAVRPMRPLRVGAIPPTVPVNVVRLEAPTRKAPVQCITWQGVKVCRRLAA